MARELGDKIGPRLASITRQHTLAVRNALAPVEAKIMAAGLQHVIDRAGVEWAQQYRPLYQAMKDAHPALDPWMADFIAQAESGQHQWQAIAGQIGLSSSQGPLGEIIGNSLAPAVYQIVGLSPNLIIDAPTVAAAAAANIVTIGDQVTNAAQLGYNETAANVQRQLAQTIPGAAQLYDLYNRGLIDRQTLRYWLSRAALPPELIDSMGELAAVLLSPPDAALAVLRGNMSMADGLAAAAANGVSADVFNVLIGNTGEPLALEEMLMLNRRGLMDDATLDRGIKQSRVRDEWIPYAKLLKVTPPSTAEILDALVQGQITADEALKRYEVAGGDPTYFETAYHATANSPSPTQLAEMANRGIIPWDGTGPNVVSYAQGFYEGRWKDKWRPAFQALTVYHPPPREIATLVKEGGMTQDEALKLWEEAGLTPELAHQYWLAAHYQRTSTAHALAQGTIVKLYTDRAISKDQALKMLTDEGWSKTDGEYLLDVADFKLAESNLAAAINKMRSLFIAYKIDAATVRQSLATLEVASGQAEQLIKIWTLEREANVKTLTASEITDAWFYELIPVDEAQAELQAIGYTAHDAGLLLSIKAKGHIQGYRIPPK